MYSFRAMRLLFSFAGSAPQKLESGVPNNFEFWNGKLKFGGSRRNREFETKSPQEHQMNPMHVGHLHHVVILYLLRILFFVFV